MMRDIFDEVSSSVPKALPPFVKEQYDSECKALLSLVEESWKGQDLTRMLSLVDKYLQYTVSETCHPSPATVEGLLPLARKLWFISMYNIITDMNTNANAILCSQTTSTSTSTADSNTSDFKGNHKQDLCSEPELGHVSGVKDKLTLKLRVRACKLLNTILEACVQLLPCAWELDNKRKCELYNAKLDFIRLEVLLHAFEEYFNCNFKDRIEVSYTKRRGWISSVVRLSSLARRIWLHRRDVGAHLVRYLFNEDCGLDVHLLDPANKDQSDLDLTPKTEPDPTTPTLEDRCEVFYKFRLLLLLCPNVTFYDLLLKGRLFRWWGLVNGETVSSWNPMFFTFFFRAAKYAWANSLCVCPHFAPRMGEIFNIMHNTLNLPNKTKAPRYKETMPGEYTCLLSKTLKLYKKGCKLLVLLMHSNPPVCEVGTHAVLENLPEVVKSEFAGATGEKSERTKSLGLENAQLVMPEPQRGDIFEFVKSMVNLMYPYTHPSSNGKWSLNISLFIKYLVLAYSRRVIRERSPLTTIYNKPITCKIGHVDLGESPKAVEPTFVSGDENATKAEVPKGPDRPVRVRNVLDNQEELGAFDFKVCDLVYGACLQGMFSKNIQICNNYEETIKRICHMCPQDFLRPTVDKMMQNCNTVNEPNQLLGSLRLLTQVSPLIVRFMPELVMPLLNMLVSFINLSEPFITTQSLILISLVLSFITTITTCPTSNLRALLENPPEEVKAEIEKAAAAEGTAGIPREPKCLKCNLDDYFFKCSILKNLSREELKRQLTTGDYNYMELILFLNNECFCDDMLKKDENPEETEKAQEEPAAEPEAEEAPEPESAPKDENVVSSDETDGKIVDVTEEERKKAEEEDRKARLAKEKRKREEALAEEKRRRAEDWDYDAGRKYLDGIGAVVMEHNKRILDELNEWSITFFDTILDMCANSSKINLKGSSLMNTVEVSTFLLIRSSLLNLLGKLTDETFTTLVNKLLVFIIEYSYKLDILKYVVSIMGCVSYINSKLFLQLTHSTLEHNLQTLFKEYKDQRNALPSSGAKERKNGGDEADKKLVWYLNCLIALVRFGNLHNLRYTERNRSIIMQGLKHGSKVVFKLTAKLLYRLAFSNYHLYILIINNRNYQNFINEDKLKDLIEKDKKERAKKRAKAAEESSEGGSVSSKTPAPAASTPKEPEEEDLETKIKRSTDRLAQELQDKILIGWHMPFEDDYVFYKDLMIINIDEVERLARPFLPSVPVEAPKAPSTPASPTSPTVLALDSYDPYEELTTYDRINRVLILLKYLVKSVLLVNTPTSCMTSKSVNAVKKHLITAINNMNKKKDDDNINVNDCEDKFKNRNDQLRYLVEGYVMTVLVKLNEHLRMNDLVLDNVDEKMTKLINFMVSRDFYSNEASGNNLDALFNSLKRKVEMNTAITSSKPMIKYLSFFYGVNTYSYLQDTNELTFISLVHDHYLHFLNLKKLNPPHSSFSVISSDKEGTKGAKDDAKVDRRDVIELATKQLLELLVKKMCMSNYKNVSANAQQILKNIMLIHPNTKYYVVDSLLDELNDLTSNLLSAGAPSEKPAKEGEEAPAPEQGAAEVATAVPANKDKVLGEAVLENIVTFFDHQVLNYLVVKLNLLEKFVTFLMRVVSLSHSKDLLMSKYDVLFIQYLSMRETPFNAPPSERLIAGRQETKRIVKMMKTLEGLVVNHWRSRLYYCSLLLVFNNQIGSQAFFANFLLQMCHHSTNHYVLSLSLQGLLTLFYTLNRSSWLLGNLDDAKDESPDGDPSEVSVYRKFLERDAVLRVFKSFTYSNHENIINSANSSGNAGTAMATSASIGFNVVMNIIKFDRTWPRNRIANNSTSISRHNFSLAYHYLKFIVSHRGLPALDPVFEVLEELSEVPQSYPENHIGFIEIVGGLLKLSLELSEELNVKLWDKLHPLLKKEFNAIVQDRTLEYMDILRLVLQPLNNPVPLNEYCKVEQKHHVEGPDLFYKYVFNFVLNFQVNPTSYNFENLFLLEDIKDDVTGYSLVVIKQLKLFQAFLQEYKGSFLTHLHSFTRCRFPESELRTRLLTVLLDNLFNESQKIRDEVSSILAFLCSVVSDEDMLTSITSYVAKKMEEKDSEQTAKGLLNLVQVLYTLPTPSVNFNGVNSYLDYSLKHLSSENVHVAELAHRCAQNVVNQFNEYDHEKVEDLFKVLIRNVKSQNKVKLTSLQLLDILYKNYCMYIKDAHVVSVLVDSYISCLADSTIRDASKNNLSNIIITLNEDCYSALQKLFSAYISEYSSAKDKGAEQKNRLILGVHGLISLVATAPYHIPTWLPNVLVELAQCGGNRYPLDVRNTVQKTLQEFFKNHVDAWEQIHANKFTKEQLDLLNTYKGSPIYFN